VKYFEPEKTVKENH